MSIKYVELRVQIHGLDIAKKKYINVLIDNIKQGLLDETLQDHRMNFRNEFDSDVEVELLSFAGEATDD